MKPRTQSRSTSPSANHKVNRQPGSNWARLLLIAGTLLLASCNSFLQREPAAPTPVGEQQPAAVAPAAQAGSNDDNDAELPSRPFDETELYELLLGEFAYQNRNMQLAIEKYIEQALATKDSGVAAHATWLAHYSRNPAAATAAAAVWYETEPDNPKAGGVFADLLSQAGKPGSALDILIAQHGRGQLPDYRVLQRASFSSEPGSADRLDTTLQRLAEQLDREPGNDGLVQTYAILLQQNGQYQQALDILQARIDERSASVQSLLLKAQLLDELDRTEEAAQLMGEAHRRQPDETQLHWHYARLLTQTDLPGAEREFEKLLEQQPDSPDVLYFHGLVAFQNQHYEAARDSFTRLARQPERADVANYFLAEIARQQDRLVDAVDHFRAVEGGKHFLPATQALVELLADRGELEDARSYLHSLRLLKPLEEPNFWAMEAKLLKRSEQPEAALEVLNRAIARFDQQIMLRIERAFLAETMGLLALAENDLRVVLDKEPQNVIALNALGYTLANRTTRYDEALQLIEQAIALSPDDAAIIDSLGWVQFRMGQYDAARKNLERAFEKYPDDEIAAHLVELYWQQGERRKLRKLLKRMRKDDAATPLIDETCTRLGIDCQ